MIYLDQMAFIIISINGIIAIWIVLGYYYYKKYYLPKLKLEEPGFADDLSELFENFSKGISESISEVKLDFDLDNISSKLTEQLYGTFLAILGVSEEEYSEEWSFKDYISKIIDESSKKIVPETIAEFEKLLPEFSDSFIKGIQEALSGVAETITGNDPNMPQQAPQGMPNMPEFNITKMIQMYFMQYMMKQMGGMAGSFDLKNLIGGGIAPTVNRQDSF